MCKVNLSEIGEVATKYKEENLLDSKTTITTTPLYC
jgi:hypothetical protein